LSHFPASGIIYLEVLGVVKTALAELERLINDNYEKMYACAYRLTGSHQDSEDVLQDSFVKAYQNIGQFRGEARLSTWLYRIVVNESYRAFEYTKKLPLTRIIEGAGISEKQFFSGINYTPQYDDNLIIEEMREKCLQGFLKCIPKNQRVCFLLKTCLELKNEEIAEVLGISPENVKVTLHRGRKKLREMFEMRCNLIDPAKPCKCYLWIKFMRDHNLPIPTGYCQVKTTELQKEYFQSLSLLRKIDYLYTVEAKCTKEEFIDRLKKAVEIL